MTFATRFGLPFALFARRYSGHRDCFLFLPVLRCFRSRGSRSLPRALGFFPSRRSHLAILGSKAACAYPRHFAACHDLPRRWSQAIPQVGSLFSYPACLAQPLHGNHLALERNMPLVHEAGLHVPHLNGMDLAGFEPATSGLQSQRSATELQAHRGSGTPKRRRR